VPDLSNDRPADFASYVATTGLSGSPFVWTNDQDGRLPLDQGLA